MITLIFAIVAAVGAYVAANYGGDWGQAWSVVMAVVGFFAVQGGLGVFLQKRVRRDMEHVQEILTSGQKRLQQKMQCMQFRPQGSIQAMQNAIMNETKVFVREALAATEGLRKYRHWVLMMDRQVATAQLQLNWMIKEFKAVDMLMPKAIAVDPTIYAIKMARRYMLNGTTAEIAKIYAKGVSRARYNGNVLLAATMSWIQVRRGDVDGAFKTLTEALRKSDNETLRQNHEFLMNNRVAHFSNSGLGDQWYSLFLEEPRIHMQRQRSVYR